MNRDKLSKKDQIRSNIATTILIILVSIVPLTVIFGIVRVFIADLHPEAQNTNWISDDGTITLYANNKGTVETENGKKDFIVFWGKGIMGDSIMKLIEEDLGKGNQSYSDTTDHNYAIWEFDFLRNKSFGITITESDFLEVGKAYTFRKTTLSAEETSLPITITDTPLTTGNALYHRGEFDCERSWDSVLTAMQEMGYTVKEKTPTKSVLYHNVNTDRYAEVFTYNSVEEAQEQHQYLIASHMLTKGAIIRINTTVIHATVKATEDMVSLFGISPLHTYATVDTITVYETQYDLSPLFETRLDDAGYSVYRQYASSSFLSCISPDANYGFNLFWIGSSYDNVEEYLTKYSDPKIDGCVYVVCHLPTDKGDSLYLLAAPVEEVSTILDIICPESI